jgi:hypothetical protein
MGRGPLPADLDLGLDLGLDRVAEDAADAADAATEWPGLAWDRDDEVGNFSPVSPIPMATMTIRQPSPISIPFRT